MVFCHVVPKTHSFHPVCEFGALVQRVINGERMGGWIQSFRGFQASQQAFHLLHCFPLRTGARTAVHGETTWAYAQLDVWA